MNQASMGSEAPATRRPIFLRITVGLLATLLLCGAAIALLLAYNSGHGGEPYRRISIGLLIVCGLAAWAFKGFAFRLVQGLLGVLLLSVLVLLMNGEVVAQMSEGSPRPIRGISASTLPDALLQHFRSRGIFLRPVAWYGGQLTEWVLENADVGPRCDVFTSFVSFPSGVDVAAMRNYLMMVSVPSVLNEPARLAVFYPSARGKTSDITACQDWSVKSREIRDQLLEAFTSYQSAGR